MDASLTPEIQYKLYPSLILQHASAQSIFLYLIIFCTCVAYFQNVNITIGRLFGMLVASLLIYILYSYERENNIDNTKIHAIESNNIEKFSNKIINYIDLTDFIFSIRDFYIYNPQAYENIIKSVEIFLEIYENVMLDNSMAGESYTIANIHKEVALNNLHSIIIMIPANKKIIGKLNDSMIILEKLLNRYLTKIINANKKFIEDNGYFNNTKIIEHDILPYNKYNAYSYDKFY